MEGQRARGTLLSRLPVRRCITSGLVAVLACVALAACGSSSSGSSGSAAASTSGSGGSATSSELAAAAAIVKQFSAAPTSLTISAPIGKPVPSGKKIDFINCGDPQCTDVGDSLSAAAKVLGWSVKVISASTSPAAIQAAFETAIQDHPSGVAFTGIERTAVNPQLAQLAKLKIPVTDCCTTDAVGGGITNIYMRAPAEALRGKVAAAYIASNSGGKANTLYVDLPVFPIYVPYHVAFEKYYKQFCPGCGLSTLPLPPTAIGATGPQQIASYLAAHRSINYVFVVNDGLGIGLPAALAAAGVTGVKYVGSDSSSGNFTAVREGKELATMPASTGEIGWYQADILARAFAGVPQIDESKIDIQIEGPNDLPANPNVITLDQGYEAQFKKLWGK